MTEKEQYLLNLFKEIVHLNKFEFLCLSGSLALVLQGVKIRREAKDIDILTETDCDFKHLAMPSGFIQEEIYCDEDDYPVGARFIHHDSGVKVEFLTKNEDDKEAINASEIWIALAEDIIRAKQSYINNNTDPESKHRLDLEYIRSNNQ